MKFKTIASVALLTVSTAALAQMTTQPRPNAGNTTAPGNTMMNSMPASPDAMNTQDETMMNDSSMPNSTGPTTIPPR